MSVLPLEVKFCYVLFKPITKKSVFTSGFIHRDWTPLSREADCPRSLVQLELLCNLFHWKRWLCFTEDMQINATYQLLPGLQMLSDFSLSFMQFKLVFELVRQKCFKIKKVNAFHMDTFYAFFSLLLQKNWAIQIRLRIVY